MQNISSILFICSGNTCRSPMCEWYFNHLIKKNNLDEKIYASSAGLLGFGDKPASNNSIAVMKELAIDISSHKSKMLTMDMLDKFDLILTMGAEHKRILLQFNPEYTDKIFTLKEFTMNDANDIDITDPFGEDIEFYRKTRDIICKCIDNLFAILLKNNDGSVV